jgi:hypothetical protein
MTTPTPEKLKGDEFESALKDAAAREEKQGLLTMDHYGVTLSVQNGITMGVQSKPDFEGVLFNGRQFIFEAKSKTGASFPLVKNELKPRQVSFMLGRAKFGVPCFLVIHWNARQLKKSKVDAFTVAIPVSDADSRWQRFVDAYAKAKREKAPVEPQGSISLEESLAIGKIVPWITPKGCRKPTPDILSFIWPEGRALRPEVVQPSLF